MSRRVSAVLGLAALLLLSACGPDLSKKTFARTTVPEASSPDAATDPKLAADRMRKIDPCALLTKLGLDRYGEVDGKPAVGTDFAECRQPLKSKTAGGKSVSIDLGTSVSPSFSKLTDKIGGLPAHEQSLTDCSEKVLTDSREHKGFQLSYSDDPEPEQSRCAAARALSKTVIEVLRTDPPPRTDTNSLALVEPCDLVDGGTVRGIVGSSPDASHIGLTQCKWTNAAFDLTVSLDIGDSSFVSKDKDVDLGNGVKAGQSGMSGVQGCAIEWLHKPDTGEREPGLGRKDEMVKVSVEDKKNSHADVCGKAIGAAKVVLPKLPQR
ncbi:hypothetical protein [Sciscionella sediminilitoris]|uniref:hypothetical protein n=1 Tax=Sciscionella sediminilitoris TaxID=1445613 RepID=UPI0004DEE6A8|nr:hypothetical protein [Sciscionella sp. SE31]